MTPRRNSTWSAPPSVSTIAGVTLGPALTLAIGCQHPPRTSTPAPAGEPALVDAPEVVAKPQSRPGSITVLRPLLPPDPETWRFDPDGRFIAASLDLGCGLWSIDDGHFGGWLDEGVDAEPCVSWPQMQRYEDWEARGPVRGSVHASFDGATLRVDDGGELRFEQRCAGCRFVSAALDRSGSRVAAAWIGKNRALGVRVYAVDGGRKLAELPLEAEDGFDERRKLVDVDLAWGEQLIAMVEVEPWVCLPEDEGGYPEECGKAPPFTVGSWTWTDLAAAPEFEPFYEEEGNIRKASWIDPSEHFWWVVVGEEQPREGISWYLQPLALDARETRLRWVEESDSEFDDYIQADTQRRWLPGPHVRWATADMGWGMGDWWLDWSIIEASPTPTAMAFDRYTTGIPDEPSWTFHDAIYIDEGENPPHARVVYEVEGCLEASADERLDEVMQMYDLDSPCLSFGTAPNECEILAASAQRGVALLGCKDEIAMADVDEHDGLALSQTLLRGRGSAWTWSPAGLLILGERGDSKLWSADGRSERALPAELVGGVRALHEPALGKDLGLALVELADALVLVDLASGGIRARIQPEGAVAFSALSPDAKLLALSDGRSIFVFELDGGPEPIARWEATKVSGLAFRQDGEVLLSGGQRPLPEHAWDPRTGAARDDQRPPEWLLVELANGDLDPSWRWSAKPDGWIVRTLDGRALRANAVAAVLDNGLMSGDPDGIRENLRAGPAPTDPVFEPEEVAALLSYPNLLEDFFTGASFPDPVLSPADIAAVLAARNKDGSR